jgi:hypothetical protein
MTAGKRGERALALDSFGGLMMGWLCFAVNRAIAK